ncbi:MULTISPECIES: ATP-binding protein [Streptomyces]|uniref:ATP-binding protein n=1 Tax=Streptomyces TaxID=1883 RepID=UPI000AEF448E|nr:MULTISPECIES: ATP-binding protein [Streptomyces]
MGLSGGAADKAGNRYENWWTALKVADLLRGAASRIRLEPPGQAGEGIEFQLVAKGETWCDQVKDVASRGPWTLKAASALLASVSGHLVAGRNVRFVLSTGAPRLHDLTVRARATVTLAEFEEILTVAQGGDFTVLCDAWTDVGRPVSQETAWRYLRSVYVEHHPPENLRQLVHLTYEQLFVGNPEEIVRQLSGYLDDNLHKWLTGSEIRNHLLSLDGVRPRLLAGDSNTLNALAETKDGFLRRVRGTAPVLGLAARPHVDELYGRLVAEEGPQIVLCEGRAGSGKSTVAVEVMERLAGHGWPIAAVRMDQADLSVRTARDLGAMMNLPDSPGILLPGVADGRPGLFVIDQLDAVSLYSGRMADVFEAVEGVLAQLSVAPNIKVLLVARTVDIEQDGRLSRLFTTDARVVRFPVGELTEESVRAVLTASGNDPDSLSPVTLELLRTPLHLAVFSTLPPASRAVSYRTLQQLYGSYTKEVRRCVGVRRERFDWQGITGALCAFMSEREILQAPLALLDSYALEDVEALKSQGVLVGDEEHIGFFHETYFDYLFARSFLTTGRDVHDFLAGSGQHLFRRAQTRQVLEHLAGTDRDRFRETTARLLGSTRIRSHLHDVITTVLGQRDATSPDWLAIEPFAWAAGPAARKVRRLLALPAWFDAADHDGRWERWLGAAETVDAAFAELLIAARHRPERATELVRPHIGTTPEWRQRLLALMEWSLTPGLVNLAVDLIQSGQADEARGPLANNSDFWSLLYSLSETAPVRAARLVGAYLDRAWTQELPAGPNKLFGGEYLSAHSQTASAVLSRIAEAAPKPYVDNILSFVLRTAESDEASDEGSGNRWLYQQWGGSSVSAELLSALDTALRALPAADPAAAGDALTRLSGSTTEIARFLACRLYTVLGAADEALDWLCSDQRNLHLGWVDSSRWASRELIAAATVDCAADTLVRLADVLFGYYPSTEQRRRVKGGPSRCGWGQYELLSAIDPARRSDRVRRRLDELERRFPEVTPSPPSGVVTAWVTSPISDRAAAHMTDAQWRRALEKYAKPQAERSWPPQGGARELADTLRTRAGQEPSRFAAFALTLGPDMPGAYLCAIVEAAAPHLDTETWEELVLHTHRTLGEEAAFTVCRALQATPGHFTSIQLPILASYAAASSPERDTRGLDEEGTRTDLLTAGLNATRGQAAITCATLLFHDARHLSGLRPLTFRLAADPVLAVRVCAAEAVRALMNHDSQTALDAADQLMTHQDLNIHNAHTTQRLLTGALARDPSRFAPHLEAALHGPRQTMELAGQTWAVVTLQGNATPDLPTTVLQLGTMARRGAATIFASNPDHYTRLLPLLDDEDEEVRNNASAVMRHAFDLLPSQADELVQTFIASKASAGNLGELAFALHDPAGPLPPAALDACEHIVGRAAADLADIRTRHAADGRYVVTAVLRLYRQSPPSMRSRCLDIIDALSRADVPGLHAALEGER